MAFSAIGSSSNLAVLKLIKMAGVDIKPVSTGVPVATFTQTMTGQVDIGWSAAPFALGALQEKRIRAVANVGDIVEYRDMSARLHVANMNFVTGKPDVLKRFLTGYSETLDWMYKSDDAARIFAEMYKVKEADTRQTRDEFYTRESLDIKRLSDSTRRWRTRSPTSSSTRSSPRPNWTTCSNIASSDRALGGQSTTAIALISIRYSGEVILVISTMVEAGAGALKYSRRTLWIFSKCSMLRT